MKPEKRERLEAAGFKSGTVAEFLSLTPEENAMVEIRVAVARLLRDARRQQRITQSQLAETLGTSQPRVAQMEAASKSVTLDLLIKSALATGLDLKQIGAAIAGAQE